MRRRWKAVPVACAIAAAMGSGTALAHDPDQGLGTPLSSPYGERFSLIANFQTPANPFNPANEHVTSSDMAFWGDTAYVGDYGGFRIFDVSEAEPELLADVRCYGPQGDPSVFDRTRDGKADTLVISVDSVLTGPECDAGPSPASSGWEGLRIFDVSDPRNPEFITGVYQDCGSHTNTLLPAPGGKKADSIYVLNSSYPLLEGPTCGPNGADEGRQVNHGVVQVVEIPFAAPSEAREITELPVVYPGDPDGTYRPITEHGLVGGVVRPGLLDDFVGCHDLSVFPAKGMVGAACGEQAQVWRINRTTGLPDTENPVWTYDQPNVDFWHSATFSWDGKVANFIDESFGDGCPTTTVKRDLSTPAPDDVKRYESGNMFFMDASSGALLSEYRIERGTNDDATPLGGQYCSSHLGITVPAKDRYLLVNAYYRGGSSVIDFSKPTAPKEIAYADMDGADTWSAYTYPRHSGRHSSIPVYSNDGLSRRNDTDGDASTPPEWTDAAYGFMRFRADIGRTTLVGLDRLNPQLQERVIPTNIAPPKSQRAKTRAAGRPARASAARGQRVREPGK